MDLHSHNIQNIASFLSTDRLISGPASKEVKTLLADDAVCGTCCSSFGSMIEMQQEGARLAEQMLMMPVEPEQPPPELEFSGETLADLVIHCHYITRP